MLNISFHHFAPFSSRAGIAAPLRSAAPLGAANARTSQKRRSLCRPPAANDSNRNSPRHARGELHFAVRQRASESECDAADCKPTRKSGLPLFLVALKNALSAHF